MTIIISEKVQKMVGTPGMPWGRRNYFCRKS